MNIVSAGIDFIALVSLVYGMVLYSHCVHDLVLSWIVLYGLVWSNMV